MRIEDHITPFHALSREEQIQFTEQIHKKRLGIGVRVGEDDPYTEANRALAAFSDSQWRRVKAYEWAKKKKLRQPPENKKTNGEST